MKKEILISILSLGFSICLDGAKKITIENNSDKPIITIARRFGCLGITEGEILTCKSETIEPKNSATLDIKYPYTSGYTLIVHQMNDQNQQLTYESKSKASHGDTVQFPENFYWKPPNFWISPHQELRLDQICQVGTHNSHVNLQEGFIYNQQIWSIKKQLNNGVRHFLLDFWEENGVAKLCHGTCKTLSLTARAGIPNKTVKSGLETIKNFLDNNPGEIVTLELENYLSAAKTYQEFQSVPGLENYILKKTDYEPMEHDGYWPTLAWFVKQEKRLIIFDTKGEDRYAFNTDRYMTRNMYGTLNVDKACTLRGSERSNRQLYQLNYFATVAIALAQNNSIAQLRQILATCQEKGIIIPGKTPNFLALDFTNLGEPFKYANMLNYSAAQKAGLLPDNSSEIKPE